MTVVRLVKKSNQDTVELFQCLLALAQIGELNDAQVIYVRNGVEMRAFTGRYRTHPPEALRAAFRTSIMLTAGGGG